MSKVSKAKLTIIKDSNGHKLLDDLKIPYRINGRNINVSMNEEQFNLFNSEAQKRTAEFKKNLNIK